ncbi:Opioid growth factor receptor (OGFr) conserved domain containing protein [Chromohalobacter japonicus]|uniref:Opioid growth factor receptor (OGFr) conserved domain containing protein n=1 Tax=Chromohalobacter japonicus TaxID=223900 RepID=A0A1Q8T9W4_9GAMM|nr:MULTISPECIES: opioid growth factor receptor-related protein [Chromohalobacter]OLO10466.1 Opioid growth factor receptor (OGFr) conserved domain containing protein [Chromohalobacter japonicus]
MNAVIFPLIRFYSEEGTDHKGRSIEDIWAMPSFWLEHTHDYIQWLFPIPEAGRFNGFAPLLDEEAQIVFAESDELRQRQRRSLDMMLDFFGLVREPYGIVALPHLNPREHIWLKRGGHNHLRISRMIRSLYLCHQPELARALQSAVIGIGTQQGFVSEQSVGYWRAAIEA